MAQQWSLQAGVPPPPAGAPPLYVLHALWLFPLIATLTLQLRTPVWHSLAALPTSAEAQAACATLLRPALARVVTRTSAAQAVQGVATVGIGKALVYGRRATEDGARLAG